MNITEIRKNFNSWFQGLLGDDEAYMLLVVILVGTAAFGLGRVSVEAPASFTAAKETVSMEARRASEGTPQLGTAAEVSKQEKKISNASDSELGKYVASKSGSKYHLPWCSGAKRIKEENKVWFETKDEAEVAGYTPAANCKGI